jgi:hypothetical protein
MQKMVEVFPTATDIKPMVIIQERTAYRALA